MVKIDDPEYASSHGIDATPQLVYFENEVPNIFAGDLSNEDEVRRLPVQGDPSGLSKPIVDIDLKVAF